MSAIRRHPLVTFFVLTYVLTWAAIPFGGFFATGPLVAALIVIPLTRGLAGLKELGLRIVRWRVRWYWYALALGLPLAVHLVTVVLNVGLGAPAPSLGQFSPFSSLIAVFAVRLINPLDGPMGEEPGWRGFALPTLQAQRSALSATLILAVLVTLWHLPLWVVPQFGASPLDIAGDVLGTLGVTLWYTWLFNHTGGSVLMTIVAHATEGTIQTEAFWSAGAAAARMSLLYGVVWCVVAIELVVFDRQLGRGPAPAPATVQPSYGGESRVR
jgi:membrane protease YdiL (CAAX protease family)